MGERMREMKASVSFLVVIISLYLLPEALARHYQPSTENPHPVHHHRNHKSPPPATPPPSSPAYSTLPPSPNSPPPISPPQFVGIPISKKPASPPEEIYHIPPFPLT